MVKYSGMHGLSSKEWRFLCLLCGRNLGRKEISAHVLSCEHAQNFLVSVKQALSFSVFVHGVGKGQPPPNPASPGRSTLLGEEMMVPMATITGFCHLANILQKIYQVDTRNTKFVFVCETHHHACRIWLDTE